VGSNAARNAKFDNTVNMWVFEEMVNDRKLTEIINTDHENVKYLPGHKLPSNVVSLPLVSRSTGALPVQKGAPVRNETSKQLHTNTPTECEVHWYRHGCMHTYRDSYN